jgi:hypothetical protein
MTESLDAHQIQRILELGAWRDEGRLFAVGLDGEVFQHEEHKDSPDERRQRQGAAASAPPPASAPSTASDAEPAGADGSQALVKRYLGFRPEMLLYYPTAHFREVDRGLWITTRIYPLGRGGPCYWVCLLLPDSAVFSPKAFAFYRLAPVPRPVGPRHTNFPDGSICAFTDEDDAWRPGDNPKILLNLYAEWLVCYLFLRRERRWPGRQVGFDATYRQCEFNVREWCHCGSGARYGTCHYQSDATEVEELQASGRYEPLPDRVVPNNVIKFAKSRWSKLPDLHRLMHPYTGQPPRY